MHRPEHNLLFPANEWGITPNLTAYESYRFVSLGSGSSGNAYLLEYHGVRLLIDAGIAPRTLRTLLQNNGCAPEALTAIFITHDHADHVRGVGVLASRYNIPVYASPTVATTLRTSRYISEDLTPFLRPMPVGTTETMGDLRITSFEVPHDSSQNVGYLLECPAGTFVLVTDVGHITSDISWAVGQANFLVLESNYDPEMLRNGTYPDFLKARITNGTGHISNVQAAEFMAKHYHLDLSYLALCHLSKENNHPLLAWKTMEHRLSAEGIRIGKDLELLTLKRAVPSDVAFLKKK